jgi:hypothetical protein
MIISGAAVAQVPDSVPPTPAKDSPRTVVTTPDTSKKEIVPVKKPPQSPVSPVSEIATPPMPDSFSKKPLVPDSGWKEVPSIPLPVQVLERHPYFGFSAEPVNMAAQLNRSSGKELLFYAFIALLLFFAFLRNAFSKYFSNLFRLFFRTTLKYRQIREQLMQTPLPSLLLNFFFVISGGLYISFLLIHFKLVGQDEFWQYALYSCLGLSAIYFVKFLGLKVIGWIFNVSAAADSYIFVVFVINKVIGVFLLPFVVMLAFMSGTGYSIALVVSWFGVGALLLYRFILSYAAVRNQVRFSPFQFFLYLCAFEIAPLLLIYKVLLVFFK